MYAVDTTLSRSVNYFCDNNFSVDTLINKELSKVIECLKNKQIIDASKYMIFHMPKMEKILILKIDNTNIGKVEEFKFFVLTIDTHL